jgi:hypothetical protein
VDHPRRRHPVNRHRLTQQEAWHRHYRKELLRLAHRHHHLPLAAPVQRPRKMQQDLRPILEQCHGASHLCRSYREEIKAR